MGYKKMFTPLNLFCVLFNWGPKCDILSAQLNRVPSGKFNGVNFVPVNANKKDL